MKLQQDFFILQVKLLVGVDRIYSAKINLQTKLQRQKYFATRISGSRKLNEGNSSVEINDEKFIMEAIDDTLMTP